MKNLSLTFIESVTSIDGIIELSSSSSYSLDSPCRKTIEFGWESAKIFLCFLINVWEILNTNVHHRNLQS